MEAIWGKISQCRNSLNPESEANEEDKMKIFEKFEQSCLEFKINSKHAVKELKKRIEGALRVQQSPIKTSKYLFSDSKVLESLDQSKLVCSFLKGKLKAADLLYRASDNDFCATQFHYKCDGIKNTLTLLKN